MVWRKWLKVAIAAGKGGLRRRETGLDITWVCMEILRFNYGSMVDTWSGRGVQFRRDHVRGWTVQGATRASEVEMSKRAVAAAFLFATVVLLGPAVKRLEAG